MRIKASNKLLGHLVSFFITMNGKSFKGNSRKTFACFFKIVYSLFLATYTRKNQNLWETPYSGTATNGTKLRYNY